VSDLNEKAPEAAYVFVDVISLEIGYEDDSPLDDKIKAQRLASCRKKRKVKDPAFILSRYPVRDGPSKHRPHLEEDDEKQERMTCSPVAPSYYSPITPEFSPITPGSSPITPNPSPTTSGLFETMIAVAVRIIYNFYEYPVGAPLEVYSRILQSSRQDENTVFDIQWSDGAAWVRTLDMTATETQRTNVLQYLGCIGAWKWYDNQIKRLSKITFRGGANPKAAATRVLNRIQYKYMRGVGAVSVDETSVFRDTEKADILQLSRKRQRNRIRTCLSKERKLSTLVQRLGFGALFDPKIG
jgi:hypothetical protein